MAIYKNRYDAAHALIPFLKKYQQKPDVVILAILRGGIEIANELQSHLHLPIQGILCKKISAPHQPELAIGAITHTGYALYDESLIQKLHISNEEREAQMKKSLEEIQKRQKLYNLSKLSLKNKTVILVDDGIATGFTMKAAIYALKELKTKHIIIATPVISSQALRELQSLADEVVYAHCPPTFHAVALYYDTFDQVSHTDVIRILSKEIKRHL